MNLPIALKNLSLPSAVLSLPDDSLVMFRNQPTKYRERVHSAKLHPLKFSANASDSCGTNLCCAGCARVLSRWQAANIPSSFRQRTTSLVRDYLFGRLGQPRAVRRLALL